MQQTQNNKEMATTEQKPEHNKVKSSFRPWRSLFSFLDKINLKKPLTRLFIFHPPRCAYNFELIKEQSSKSDPSFEFLLKQNEKPKLPSYMKIKAFKLYRKKDDKIYMTPLLWLINQRSTSEYIVLYSHGNSSDLGTAYGSALTFSAVFNMNVVVYDYTGYGLSPHKPSEKNLFKDIECVLSFIVNFLNYPLNKVILVGFSLGTGPTIEMASRFQSIPFIILFAPLSSCLSVVEGKNAPDKNSSHDIFANLDKIPKLACDALFVHGEKDSVIPHHHSTRLFNRYLETHKGTNNSWLLEVENADHHDLVQELGDPNTEYRRLFMRYFDFLVDNNHTVKDEKKAAARWKERIAKQESFLSIGASIVAENVQQQDATEDVIKEVESDLEEEEEEENKGNEEQKGDENQEKEEYLDKDYQDLECIDDDIVNRSERSESSQILADALKRETMKLRNTFTRLTINKVPLAKKNPKPKNEYDNMVNQAKALL